MKRAIVLHNLKHQDKDCIAMRYSENRIKIEVGAIRVFLFFYPLKPVEEINKQDAIKFNIEYMIENHTA